MADSISDPNSDKRFRLLQDEEGAPPSTPPVPLPKDSGTPPGKPPIAPPLAAVPDPDPNKQPNTFELKIKQLQQENDQLVCALYYLQQELKELRDSK